MWHLLALLLPVAFILAIALRPGNTEKVQHPGEPFLMEIRNTTDSTSLLVITVTRPLEVPSCLVFVTIKGKEFLSGKLDHQGEHSYEIPAPDKQVAIRLYDPIGKKTIETFNPNY